MLLRRVADIDEIDIRIVKELIKVVVGVVPGEVHLRATRAEVASDAAPVAGPFFGVPAANTGHPSAFEFAGGQVVNHAHKANADDANSHHF